jgi:hypothetical protein
LHDEPKLKLNLPPGKHECYLSIIPKDKDEEIYQSNLLVCTRNNHYVPTSLSFYCKQKFDIPSTVGNEPEQKQTTDPSNVPDHVFIQLFLFIKINYRCLILESS